MPKHEYDWEIGQPPPLIEPHTIVKQAIYQSYIEQYIKTLIQRPSIPSLKLAVVDAFAGGGLYLDDNANEHQGSPVKIIEAIKNGEQLVNSNRSSLFTVDSRLFFIEKKKSVFEYLENHLSKIGIKQQPNIKLIPGNFEKTYLDIVTNISDSIGETARSIFILDQYGYVDVPFECIRRIFDLLKNSEVILTLSVNHLIDYIANPETETRKAAQQSLFSEAEPTKKIESAKQVKNYVEKLGLNINELQEDKLAYPKTYRGIIQTKVLEKLLLFSNAKYYTAFFLGEVGNHRDIWLIHLSNHSKARSVMINIHWQYANNNKAIISHYGTHGLDILGFIGKKDIIGQPELFESKDKFNFNEHDKRKMGFSIQEDMPKWLYAKEVKFKDFYNDSANHCLASKEQLLDLSKELLQCKEIEAIGEKGEQRRSDIKTNDIIRLPTQKFFHFKK